MRVKLLDETIVEGSRMLENKRAVYTASANGSTENNRQSSTGNVNQ